jgi:hypothetical protein
MIWPAHRPTGVIHLSDSTTRALRIGARVLAGIAWVTLAGMAARGQIPTNPQDILLVPYEAEVQLALLALVGLGILASLAWPAVGATMLALGGTGLAVHAAVAYPTYVVLFVAVAFLTPSVMLWLAWQRDETRRRILTLAAVTSGLLLIAGVGASEIRTQLFGFAADQSDTAALTGSDIRWAWAGAVSDTGFEVVARPAEGAQTVGLLVTAQDGSERLVDTAEVVDGVATLQAEALQSDLPHTYRFLVDDQEDAWVGRVRTFPRGSDGAVTIGFSSCAGTGSNAAVFDEIRRQAPDLFVFTGDLHYANISANDPSMFAAAYDTVLGQPAPAAMLREMPIAYVWDDHDYGPNDADRDSPAKPAAHSAYRIHVPYGDLPVDGTIAQAFDAGPVRVLLTDLRSERSPDDQTLLGADQRAWLERQLLAARDEVPLVIWVSPSPWIAKPQAGQDHWGGYAAERRDLADFIAMNDIDNLLIVSGDAHMLAIDDGSHSDFTSAAAGPSPEIPVLAAAALDRPGSEKGGPYSTGMYPGPGQFGLVHVDPQGDAVTVRLEARTDDGQVLLQHEFSRPIR